MYCNLHYFTLSSSEIDDKNTAVTFYHEKNKRTDSTNPYEKYMEAYLRSKGQNCFLPSKRISLPNKLTKLKEQLKELGSLLGSTQNLTNNVHVIKQIWCCAHILLLVLQDATLVWIHVHPKTCNLNRIQIDKTLSSSVKLSGKIVCDLKIVQKTNEKFEKVPLLVIVYADRFKVDFISFGKFSAFNKSLDGTNEKLEKLSTFEPTLTSFDIDNQPGVNRIDKFIIVNGFNSSNVTVWWKSDGQIIWTPTNTMEKSINLLKNSNIIIFNIEHAQFHIDQAIKTQSGQLISLFYRNEKTLVAVEQIELKIKQYQIDIYRYEFNYNNVLSITTGLNNSLVNTKSRKFAKTKLSSIIIDCKIEKPQQIINSKNFLIIITNDYSLYLYNLNSNIIRMFKQVDKLAHTNASKFCHVEWLLEDLLFFIYDPNGNISVYDIAFNEIDLVYEKRDIEKFKMLVKKGTSLLTHFTSYHHMCADFINIGFYFQNCVFGVLQVKIPHNLNEIALITTYLKQSKVKSAINLLLTFDWDAMGTMTLIGFYKIINYLLNAREFNADTQIYIEQTLTSFYKPQKQLNENTIKFYKFTVTRYVRRYFYKLLRFNFYDKAYLLASDIGAKDLFNDLYYCALNRRLLQLAEICRKKCKELESNDMIMNLNSREEIYFMNNRNVELRDDEIENKSSDGYDSDEIVENSDDDFFDNDTSFEQHYVDRNFIFLEDDRLVSSLDQKLNFDKINFNSTFKSIDDEFQTFKSFFKFNDKIISSGNSSFKS